MKRLINVFICACISIAVFIGFGTEVHASSTSTAAELEGQLMYYYENSSGNISDVDVQRTLYELKSMVSADEYNMYVNIMNYWSTVDSDTFPEYIYYDDTNYTLPPNVPASGHAFVVLGYALNPDGSLQDEAKGRCDAAYTAAINYPNSKIVLTGGGTAKNNPNVTEAGQMADYLESVKGLDASRILMENQAKNTAENATNTTKLLHDNGISSITIISSQYHLRRGCLLFYAGTAKTTLDNGWSPITLVDNFGWYRSDKTTEGIEMEGMSLSQVMGVSVPSSHTRPGEPAAVLPSTSVLDSITFSGPTSYTVGQSLTLTATAHYTNADYVDANNPTGLVTYTQDVTTTATVTGYDPNATGEQTITYTYTENGVEKTGTITVTVEAAPVVTPVATAAAKSSYCVTFLDCNGNTVSVQWVDYQGSATAPAGYGTYSGYTNVSSNMDLKPASCTVKYTGVQGYVVPDTADRS